VAGASAFPTSRLSIRTSILPSTTAGQEQSATHQERRPPDGKPAREEGHQTRDQCPDTAQS